MFVYLFSVEKNKIWSDRFDILWYNPLIIVIVGPSSTSAHHPSFHFNILNRYYIPLFSIYTFHPLLITLFEIWTSFLPYIYFGVNKLNYLQSVCNIFKFNLNLIKSNSSIIINNSIWIIHQFIRIILFNYFLKLYYFYYIKNHNIIYLFFKLIQT